LATKCEVQLSYAIGVVRPVSIRVETFGTGTKSEQALVALVQTSFDLTPKGIIKSLNLLEPRYSQTSCYGHFGREEPAFTWEKIKQLS
ncbi:UNVERIFIED_CONTAM: hypothetical protein GTU68_026644, partial [Idotea baltica]|nr:hypothetical protein [Idotea baltica]